MNISIESAEERGKFEKEDKVILHYLPIDDQICIQQNQSLVLRSCYYWKWNFPMTPQIR